MKGAIEKATELVSSIPNAWMPQQFDNKANVDVHRKTTAQEIIKSFPEGLDYLITGVGTGGHITGVAEVLKAKFPSIKVFAVEPVLSPVLSGGAPGPHPLQGIGAGFVPSILNKTILDGIIQVDKEESFDYAKRIAKEEGIFVGISTGASLAALAKKLKEIPAGSRVLTFNYDTGERYLSVEGLY
jgi:cysteine synthase A